MKSPLDTQEDQRGIKYDLVNIEQEDDLKSERYSALMIAPVIKGFNQTFIGRQKNKSQMRENPSLLSNITLP